jgi:hypothetical protein
MELGIKAKDKGGNIQNRQHKKGTNLPNRNIELKALFVQLADDRKALPIKESIDPYRL